MYYMIINIHIELLLLNLLKQKGVYLKDWDNFRPFYNPNPPNIKINDLIQNSNNAISKANIQDFTINTNPVQLYQNRINNIRSNFTFSIALINMLNEYVSNSKKLVNMNFLYNSVGMVPVEVLKENYSYFTFPLLEENNANREFNIELRKGTFRNTALSLLIRMNQIDKNIQKIEY